MYTLKNGEKKGKGGKRKEDKKKKFDLMENYLELFFNVKSSFLTT